MDDNFINEERFAALFVRGKVNVKRWGLYKIREGLGAKGVSSAEIAKAIETIDREKYQENLNYLVQRKVELQPEFAADISKLYRFLQSKGYESDEISKVLREKKLMTWFFFNYSQSKVAIAEFYRIFRSTLNIGKVIVVDRSQVFIFLVLTIS